MLIKMLLFLINTLDFYVEFVIHHSNIYQMSRLIRALNHSLPLTIKINFVCSKFLSSVTRSYHCF